MVFGLCLVGVALLVLLGCCLLCFLLLFDSAWWNRGIAEEVTMASNGKAVTGTSENLYFSLLLQGTSPAPELAQLLLTNHIPRSFPPQLVPYTSLLKNFVGTDSVSLPLFLTKTSGGQVALALSTFWHAKWFTRMLNLNTLCYLLPTFVSHAHTLFCPPFFPQRHLVTSIYSMAHGAVIATFLVASRYRYIPNTLGRKRSR